MVAASPDIDLEPAHCIARYRNGYYPYFDRRIDKFYWDREPRRSIIPIDSELLTKISRIEKRLPRFRISRNAAFDEVLSRLGDPAIRQDTWLVNKVIQVYRVLHGVGHALSYEAWDRDTLVGGLLAVDVGRVVAAETMFRVVDDASKACLCRLIADVAKSGVIAIDVQVAHPPESMCGRLGEVSISLEDYLKMIDSPSPGASEQTERM